MEVEDAYNAAGVLVEAIRCAGLAQRNGVKGVLEGPSAWFCKHPPTQLSDAEAFKSYKGACASFDKVDK